MHVGDIMNVAVETIAPDQSAETAWHWMRQRGIRHLVVTRGRAIAGVISDRDLGGARGDTWRKGRKVGELVSGFGVAVARTTTTIRQAAQLMRGRSIGCLPVVDAKRRLVGVVTTSDLLDLIGRGTEREIRPYARPRPRRRPRAAPGPSVS